ncbi:MAG: tRNA-dihydrouridine synthase family protein [Firmicutes bacterium]|nr:tRNA-dihydrouridine synthase family protein [Bacillota bacterium]
MKDVVIEAAPIAGWTDQAFRRVLVKCGAKVVYTEMVSATALAYESEKTLELLKSDFDILTLDNEKVKTIVQLFGKTPEHFEYAIKSKHLVNFDEININIGCPAPKIIKNGEGSALMKTPELARKIITACVNAEKERADKNPRPITVKVRLGFTEPSNETNRQNSLQNLVDFAKMCEQAGAARIIVHGRYASQGYSGIADWKQIANVVNAVQIPVTANGDIVCEQSAKKCLDITNAKGLMVARVLFGKPWMINNLAQNISLEKIKEIIQYHIKVVLELQGENGFREMKKHLLAYCDSLKLSKEIKRKVAVSGDFAEARKLMDVQ